MRKFFHLFMAMMVFVLHPLCAKADSGFPEPDFAFPKTVMSQALNRLGEADSQAGAEADRTRLRAMLEYISAAKRLDPDSAFAMPHFVARQIQKLHTPDAKAIALILEAKTYNEIYSARKYKYNKVSAPLMPLPSDIAEWSGEQFRFKINSLCNQATAMNSKAPLNNFEGIINYDNTALLYFPDVADFCGLMQYAITSSYAKNDDRRALIDSLTNANRELSNTWCYWTCEKAETSSGYDGTEFLNLYKKYARSENARLFLVKALDSFNDTHYIDLDNLHSDNTDERTKANEQLLNKRAKTTELIALSTESLKQYPAWWGNDDIENGRRRYSTPAVQFSLPKYSAPGNVDITLASSFTDDVKIEVYYVSSDFPGNIRRDRLHTLKNVATVNAGKTSADSCMQIIRTQVSLDKPGYYALRPAIDNGNSYVSFGTIAITPFAVGTITTNDSFDIITTDYVSGKPLDGVKVLYTRGKKTSALGTTDKNGLLKIKRDERQGRNLEFEYNGIRYNGNNFYLPPLYDYTSDDSISAQILTDRPLYHPGDSISWSVIAYNNGSTSRDKAHVAPNLKLRVELKDANYSTVDTIIVYTDRFGRSSGCFKAPQNGLTGDFHIIAHAFLRDEDNEEDCLEIGEEYVMVSDFKLPQIETRITDIQRDVPQAGMVRVSGEVHSFSGMPIANAKTELELSELTFYSFYYPSSESVDTLTTTTDDAGIYTFDIPAKALEYDPDSFFAGNFRVSVTATSNTGETASDSRSFSVGKPYRINPGVYNGNFDAAKTFAFKPTAVDANDREATIALKWAIFSTHDGTIAADASAALSGNCTSGKTVKVALGDIKAGSYVIQLTPADTTLANRANSRVFKIYNSQLNLVPDGAVLFVPVNSAEADSNGRVSVTVGTPDSTAYVYSSFCANGKQVEIALTPIGRGFKKLEFTLPKGSRAGSLAVVAFKNGKSTTGNIAITTPDTSRVILKGESFRDRLIPGAREQWRFRLLNADSLGVGNAAAAATIYNYALLKTGNVNAQFGRQFNIFIPSSANYIGIARNYNNTISARESIKLLKSKTITPPHFIFDTSLTDKYAVVGYGVVRKQAMTRSNSLYGASLGIATDEAAAEEGLVLQEVVTTAYAAASDSAETEKAANNAGVGSEDATPEPSQADDFQFRDAETLQAYWNPTLLSDSEGNIDICFTTPNANGKWQFNLFAWTPDLRSADFAAQCISSKPVMVQPNLPRFMRQGDSATLLATVFNNTDTTACISTVVEVFDTTTGSVIATATSSDTLAAKGSAIASIDISAPTDAAAIGYRVRSSSNRFSDGEQTLVPILASASTVIESTEFYLDPGRTEPYTLTLDAGKSTTNILQYCQNPIWDIVRALRGISSGGNTATSAATALFSTMAAHKIMADNPSVENVVRTWLANPSQEALKPMLEKNAELKLLMLGETPWVQSATSQTRRMQEFASVFNRKTVEDNISTALTTLRNLQNADGGFRWGSWSDKSSPWITGQVLTTLGLAKSLGMFTNGKSMDTIISRALNYLDSNLPEHTAPDYTLTLCHSLFPEHKPTLRGKQIMELTIQDILAGWKNDTAVDKAYDILILNANGNKAAAATILESLREFSVIRPGMGLMFPSVNDIRGYATIIQAFSAMNATAKELDAMRQWIILRSQVTDNLGACNPDYVIASVMLTGSVWTNVDVSNSVSVNGRPLSIADEESASGYFSQTLPHSGDKLVITIQPNGETPSYGSVTSISCKSMTSVKARPGKDISIEKRVLVNRNGKWVETNELLLGERARISLTIKTRRDLQYVSIADERPASFEPVEQLPGYVYSSGTGFYRENRDAETRLFISYLHAGTYHLTYDMTAAVAGKFISGTATVQSQYAPEITAHSSGSTLFVK